MTKIYVTKYALTSGISEHEAELSPDGKSAIFYTRGYMNYYSGFDFHLNKEDALIRAQEMRINKLKSLDKQIKKLSSLKF